MNIAFLVIDITSIGGVERVYCNLSHRFVQDGLPLRHVISIDAKHDTPQYHFPESLKFHYLNKSGDDWMEALRSLIHREQITIIIFAADNMTMALKTIEATTAVGVQAIAHYHGSVYAYLSSFVRWSDIVRRPALGFKWLHRQLFYPFKIRKLRSFVRKANPMLITVSEGAKQELRELLGKDADYVRSIRNLVLSERKSNIDLSAKHKEVVYVGRLEERHKNTMLILESWRLCGEHTHGWSLRFVGDGSMRKQMEDYANKHNMHNVEFVGWVKDVSQVYKRSSIAVLSSHCEGLSMSMVEAAQWNNVLLSTNARGGVTDIVRGGINGLIVDTNKESFAKGLIRLLSDEELRHRLAKQNTRVLLDFDSDGIMQQWQEVLKL